jgi:hypothetical protein
LARRVYIIDMVGKIIRFVDSPEDRYPTFVGHCGYVISSARASDSGALHVAVKWFKPYPVYSGSPTRESHFAADKFEVVS